MTLWLDEHFSPKLAPFLTELTGVICLHIKDVIGHGVNDYKIYQKAKSAKDDIIIISKDFDIVMLFNEFGPPPGVIWVNTYNLTNRQQKELFTHTIKNALDQVQKFHFATIEN
jgi:predicted nuclease of predicted toxin-antitoxin system